MASKRWNRTTKKDHSKAAPKNASRRDAAMAGYVSRTYSSALSPTVQLLTNYLKQDASVIKGRRCVVVGADAAYAPVKNAGAKSVAIFAD